MSDITRKFTICADCKHCELVTERMQHFDRIVSCDPARTKQDIKEQAAKDTSAIRCGSESVKREAATDFITGTEGFRAEDGTVDAFDSPEAYKINDGRCHHYEETDRPAFAEIF